MGVVLTVVGVMVVVLGLWDMFRSLLRPKGQGIMSGLVSSGVWRISRMIGHRFGSAVGPAGMILVILLWVMLQGLGWTLIYFPHVPDGFSYSSGVDPGDYPAFSEALYISFVALATLGFGDVVAVDPWLRLLIPLQALTGFALLTAALTWFNQVHPPVSHRRALALNLRGLNDVGYARAVPDLDPSAVARVIDDLSGQIRQVCVDFLHYSESYYFQEEDPGLSLARQLPHALELRDAAGAAASPEVRMSAARLSAALTELSAELADDFISGSGDDPAAVFAAYAADHDRDTRP